MSFCGFTLYNREYFVFREPIGDALNHGIKESAAPGWSLNPCDAVITNIGQCV